MFRVTSRVRLIQKQKHVREGVHVDGAIERLWKFVHGFLSSLYGRSVNVRLKESPDETQAGVRMPLT
jgi:hypothetical protein